MTLYKSILDLEKYVQDMLDAKEPWHPNDTVEMISKKVEIIKDAFLKGE